MSAPHVIRGRALVEDAWQHVADGEPLPQGDVIVPLARWRSEREALLARNGGLGVRLKPDDDPASLAADLPRLAVVALEFPKFTDGRAYSHARTLRVRFGYAGELRAVGDVLRDQLAYMERCGFDAYELKPGKDPEDALNAFGEIRHVYQRAARGSLLPRRDTRPPVA